MRLGKGRLFAWNSPQVAMVRSPFRSYRAVHPFDERFGVDTGELIYDLPGGGNSQGSNNGYCAVPPSVFHSMIERMHLDYPRFTFIDLGSGKGRELLLASGYAFREVIGVEISPRLDRIAHWNIRQFARSRSGSPIVATRADVADFRFPPGPLLVYMWNAFTEPVLDRVLDHLWESYQGEPREVYLLYVDPDLDAMLAAEPWVERMWSSAFRLSAEDYEAWAFPDHTELCTAYRIVNRGNAFFPLHSL